MNTAKLATEILRLLGRRQSYLSKQDTHGRGVGHAIWMLEGVKCGYVTGEKSHRWIGYAEGILVAGNVVDLGGLLHLEMIMTEFGVPS